jgi:hypothetical protein
MGRLNLADIDQRHHPDQSRTAGVDVNRTFLIAGAIPAIRDRDVLPSELRSRLNVADKSQRRRDLGKLGSRRKAFERRPDCGLRVGEAPR